MPDTYQPKVLPDGTANPRFRPDTRKRPPRARSPESVEKNRAAQRERNTQRTRINSHYPARPQKSYRPLFGWDGEGANYAEGEPHRYIMAVCREERRPGVTDYQDIELVNGFGLTTIQLLEFLCRELHARRHGINVGFFFSYDVNMILRDLPIAALTELHTTGQTFYKKFRLEYRPRKSFAVSMRRAVIVGETVEWTWIGGRIWDVFGFFQSSFVEALYKYHIISDERRDAIHAMKLNRSMFKPEETAHILHYCREECEALALMMRRVLASHQGADLHLTRFDGAGASAAALLRRERVKQYMGPRAGEWPERVRNASQYAYGGGRIELLQYGHHPGPVYRYDVRSAYPAAMVNLPCLACGGWTDKAELGASPLQVVRVEWDLHMVEEMQQDIYPFFWRAHDGKIYYPPGGVGFYWTSEIQAARRLLAAGRVWRGTIDITATYSYLAPCTHSPFGFVPLVYAERNRLKQEGNGAEKALKLAINALYGRTAMRVGGRDGEAPGSHQLEWAGAITAQTRAWLLTEAVEAARTGHLIMLATDGIFTTRALGLASEGLGGWEESVFESGTFVQSGVYWLGSGTDETSYYRGFDRGALRRDRVLAAWRQRADVLQCPLTRFITLGRALASRHPRTTWRTWATEDRTLELIPSGSMKREARPRRSDRPAARLYDTFPVMPGLSGALSWPTQLPWRGLKGARRDEWDTTDDTDMEDL